MGKKKLNLDIAIIGSGPAALAAALSAKAFSSDAQITIYDIGRTANSPQLSPNKASSLKLFDKQSFSYDQNEFLQLESMNSDVQVLSSAGFGGFSKVWGAVVEGEVNSNSNRVTGATEINKSLLMTSSGRQMHKNFSKKIDSGKFSNFKLLNHTLAVEASKCTNCGLCMLRCPTDAIWFAGNSWDKIKDVRFVLDTFVLRIVEGQGTVRLFTKNHEYQHQVVIVASGAVGSATLLIRSDYLPNIVELSDSQLIILPILRLPILEKQGRFALSQISLRVQMPNKRLAHVQIYPDTRSLIENLKQNSLLAKLLPNVLLRLLTRFLSIAFVYLDSENSHGIILESKGENFTLSKKSSLDTPVAISWVKRNLPNFFRNCRYWVPKFLISVKPVGSSFHIGGSIELKNQIALNNFQNILVVGSLTHPDVEAGPVTSRIINDAIGDTRSFLERFQ